MKGRIARLDSLRGFALVLMTAYHICFDLDYFGVLHIDFHSPIWESFRTLIVALFVGIAGAGFALARHIRWARLGRLAAGAALVSLGTRWLFPDAWVYFGVLHFLVVASLLAPLLARFPLACLPLGLVLVAIGHGYRSFFFERPLWRLSGLSPVLPRTIDFVPLLPWLGVVMIGVFLGTYASRLPSGKPGPLAFLGRHSLAYYLGHQAVLLPVAWAVSRI